jgi:transcriptional regulator with XRE-family HTH domain
MARLRAEGLTFVQIARVFGVTKQRVGKVLRDITATTTAARCCACRAVVADGLSQVPNRTPMLCLGCLARAPGVAFGERLRTHRLTAGLTQEQLARKAAVTAMTISLYERGARRPTSGTLGRLAEVLGAGLLDPRRP